ncbi:MAG: spore maturation protein, partial [Candidatus Eisenbacteria bacterium]|nr:spore maturation protein [Candidatus Eisenbacteria bacterium]
DVDMGGPERQAAGTPGTPGTRGTRGPDRAPGTADPGHDPSDDLVDEETRESEAAAAKIRAGWSKMGLLLRRLTVIGVFVALGVGLVRTLLDPKTFQRVVEATGEIAQKGWIDVVGDLTSAWILPLLIALIALYGWLRGVRVYESLVTGAREGFTVAIRIIPYLVAILVAVGMFQASGALDLLIRAVAPVTGPLGLPGEALPMALLRPLSGSGAFGVMAHALETYGTDSYVGYLVSTLQGSTETTFYVLAVYFGSVAVRRTRYALGACLLADAAGIAGPILDVNLFTSF